MQNQVNSTFKFSVKDIVEIAIFVSLAVVLDTFVKIPVSLTGGSVNISMVPLFIISLRKGWFKGFICGGIIFGLLTCLLDGYGFASYPFDYLFGFGSVAILSIFSHNILSENETGKKEYLYLTLGITLSFIIRFIFAMLSGWLIYSYHFIPNLTFQITYIVPTYIFDLLVMILLLKPIKSLKKYN